MFFGDRFSRKTYRKKQLKESERYHHTPSENRITHLTSTSKKNTHAQNKKPPCYETWLMEIVVEHMAAIDRMAQTRDCTRGCHRPSPECCFVARHMQPDDDDIDAPPRRRGMHSKTIHKPRLTELRFFRKTYQQKCTKKRRIRIPSHTHTHTPSGNRITHLTSTSKIQKTHTHKTRNHHAMRHDSWKSLLNTWQPLTGWLKPDCDDCTRGCHPMSPECCFVARHMQPDDDDDPLDLIDAPPRRRGMHIARRYTNHDWLKSY